MNGTANKIIEENLYLSIATTNGDEPWISNLYYVFDGKSTFYWYSSKNSNHSNNIKRNKNVAICIFNSTSVGDDVNAFYSIGTASEVTDIRELSKALIMYGKKMIKTDFISKGLEYLNFVKNSGDFRNKSPLRMYKAVVSESWCLAPSVVYKGKYLDGREKVNL